MEKKRDNVGGGGRRGRNSPHTHTQARSQVSIEIHSLGQADATSTFEKTGDRVGGGGKDVSRTGKFKGRGHWGR